MVPLLKGAKMKNLDVKSKMSLIRVKRLLVDGMEILNSISEEDFKKIVLFSQRQKKHLKNIVDNVERGNIFMIIFFLRELVESLLNSED